MQNPKNKNKFSVAGVASSGGRGGGVGGGDERH